MTITVYTGNSQDHIGSTTTKHVFEDWKLPLPRRGDWLCIEDEEYKVKFVLFDMTENEITINAESQ